MNVFRKGIYIFSGCGIFEMILKNPYGSVEQALGYCSHQHIDS